MKKFLIAVLALILIGALFGCGKDKGTSPEAEPAAEESVETVEEEEETEPEPSETAEPEEESSDSDSAVISPEFKQTMDDYEAWFDHYCDVMKRYKEDSSNLELLSEMTELLSEETTMLEKMDNMDQSDMNTAELAYYLEVTARIEKKLLEVGY